MNQITEELGASKIATKRSRTIMRENDMDAL